MSVGIKRIAVVQGAGSGHVQDLLADFVERWRFTHRCVGVIERLNVGDHAAGAGRLIDIARGDQYPLFQDLGPGSTACALHAVGAVIASEAVSRQIADGCDIAVLSKFGKLEAESRSGLISAFGVAVEAGVPILTSVAPKYNAAWSRFAAPLFVVLTADAAAIDNWWRAVCPVHTKDVEVSQFRRRA